MTVAAAVLARIPPRLAPLANPRAIPGLLAGEWRSMPRALRIWLLVLVALSGPLLVGALLALPPGWEVFGTSPTVEWGFMIVAYAFFAVTTSGLCLTSSLGTVFGIRMFRPLEKRHAILAVLSLTTAFAIIALDLQWPFRIMFGVVLSPAPTSPMWWMGVCYGGYFAILLVEVWSMFTNHPRVHSASCTAAACMAVIAPATLGAVFGVLLSRPFWHGPLSSILMVGAAVLAGASLLALVFGLVSVFRLRDHENARRYALGAIAAVMTVALLGIAILLGLKLAPALGSRDVLLDRSTRELVAGGLAPWFWIGRVAVGLVIPLVLIWVPVGRRDVRMAVAGAAGLLGVLVDRALFVLAGQVVPTSSAVGGVVSRPVAGYTPSPVEIAILVGAIATFALLYTLIERYVDLGEAEAHDPYLARVLRMVRERLASRTAEAVAEGEWLAAVETPAGGERPVDAAPPADGAGPADLGASAGPRATSPDMAAAADTRVPAP
jgi:Ni/Fe-hydrogenase subunit HybB-like protein